MIQKNVFFIRLSQFSNYNSCRKIKIKYPVYHLPLQKELEDGLSYFILNKIKPVNKVVAYASILGVVAFLWKKW